MNLRRILITGGAGFIGSNLVRYLLKNNEENHVYVLDSLTYAGSLDNLEGLSDLYPTRYRFIRGDIRESLDVSDAFQLALPHVVFHCAAESHVDRSIDDPLSFLKTNVLGTGVLAEYALQFWKTKNNDSSRRARDFRFISVSTDEVFGSLPLEDYAPPSMSLSFSENSPYQPSSPYAASKAAADHWIDSLIKTFGFPAIVTHCTNNYGPYQFPEKLIPRIINNLLYDRPVPIYGDGKNVRDWIYVEDHCRALDVLSRAGKLGEHYCIGARSERSNLQVAHEVCKAFDHIRRPRHLPNSPWSISKIEFVEDRPGHDRRYAINPTKMESLSWMPQFSFEERLGHTMAWYLAHPDWCEARDRESNVRLGKTSNDKPISSSDITTPTEPQSPYARGSSNRIPKVTASILDFETQPQPTEPTQPQKISRTPAYGTVKNVPRDEKK